MRAVSGTAGTDTTSPLWQPQPAKTTRREWHEERGLPQWLSHIVSSGVQLSGDDRASAGSSSRSSGGSSSESLLDEGDWVDTDDGRTYLKSDSGDGGTDYIDSSGEYVIHKNSDGSGAIADGYGNVAVDSDGDGELDKYSTDNGKSWNAL